jgi:hypothetical protein
LYEGIDLDKPLGKDRIICCEENSICMKDIFEKMIICPERKIFIKTENSKLGIITLSDIFNVLNLEI